jgi:hypothetical protein
MQTAPRAPEGTQDVAHRFAPDDTAVRATLDLILQSQPFRTSKQCQNLLSYIVDRSLNDDGASLRERILGIEVFGRSPDYDTSEDPVVRMRAADVRKRLAQFYQGSEHDPSLVHIELKPGSYRATFHYVYDAKEDNRELIAVEITTALDLRKDPVIPEVASVVVHAEQPARARFYAGKIILSCLLVFVLGLVGWRIWMARPASPQQRFWAPLIHSNQPILLYLGANVAYRFTPEYMAQYQKAHALKENGPEFFVDLPKGSEIKADDFVPVKDTFISVADLAASVQMVSLLDRWHKPFNLRSASDLSMSDIRNTPTVLIGGFNNTWTLETTKDLPYTFRDGIRIEKKNDLAHSWTIPSEAQGPRP